MKSRQFVIIIVLMFAVVINLKKFASIDLENSLELGTIVFSCLI